MTDTTSDTAPDPLALLAQVPRFTHAGWSTARKNYWADHVVPAHNQEQALLDAYEVAYNAGARGEELPWATAHVLVTEHIRTHSFDGHPSRALLREAYSALERSISDKVCRQLPARAFVSHRHRH